PPAHHAFECSVAELMEPRHRHEATRWQAVRPKVRQNEARTARNNSLRIATGAGKTNMPRNQSRYLPSIPTGRDGDRPDGKRRIDVIAREQMVSVGWRC